MSRAVRVEEIDNGYLLTFSAAGVDREAYPTLDEVLTRLLSFFEWRGSEGRAEWFGQVVVERGERGEWAKPKEKAG